MLREGNQLYEFTPTMTEVRLSKEDVLSTLMDNRENHRAKFEEAMEGYKEQAIKTLEKHIAQIKANDPQRVMLSLPLPEDHTDDYDRAIDMLQWSLDDEVVLNNREFQTYIQDDWGWKQEFESTYSMYTSSG